MKDRISETIRNLEFMKDFFARQIKKKEFLISEKKSKEIIRTTIASLYAISRKQNLPELKVLSDNIYRNISSKPENKWRKNIYIILGVIFTLTLSVILEAPIDLSKDDPKEISEEERKLREAYIHSNSAIKILSKLKK